MVYFIHFLKVNATYKLDIIKIIWLTFASLLRYLRLRLKLKSRKYKIISIVYIKLETRNIYNSIYINCILRKTCAIY